METFLNLFTSSCLLLRTRNVSDRLVEWRTCDWKIVGSNLYCGHA